MQTAGDDVSGAAAARSEEESSTSTATIGANASGGMTAEQEMQFQQAKTLLEQEKFEEASDILSSLLASRVETDGQLAPGLVDLYCVYGVAMLEVAKKESVDLLSSIMRRKMRERSGEPEDEEEDEEEDEAAAASSAEESLEIAWEVLDTARVILEKDESQVLRLADVHLRLAEIHEESDNIAAAIEEHERALGLIQTRLEPHSRLIAEVYSRLAFDYSLEKRNEEARKAHVKAAECVEKRLALLEDEIAGDKGKGKSEDSPAATEEIAELRAILEDLREKIEGLQDAAGEDAAMRVARAMFSPPSAQAQPPVSAPLEDKQAPAPSSTAPGQPAVHHLGVFGRSKKIPFPSASTSTASATTTATPVESEETKGKRKRTEEQLRTEQPATTLSGEAEDSSSKSDEVALKRPKTDQ